MAVPERSALRHPVVVGVLVGVITTVLGGFALEVVKDAWKARSPTLTRTDVRFVKPLIRGTDDPTYDVRQSRASAECLSDLSTVSSEPEAYRCFTHPWIYDPCFPADPGRVACLSSPWERQAILLKVRKWTHTGPGQKTITTKDPVNPRLRSRGRPKRTQVWGFELANGRRCSWLSGAGAPMVQGMRINYQCDRGVAVGDPLQTRQPWTIGYARELGDEIRAEPVRVAWY